MDREPGGTVEIGSTGDRLTSYQANYLVERLRVRLLHVRPPGVSRPARALGACSLRMRVPSDISANGHAPFWKWKFLTYDDVKGGHGVTCQVRPTVGIGNGTV